VSSSTSDVLTEADAIPTCESQILRYTIVVTLSCTLEALSDQNDNLTLPLYMWSLLVVVDV